MLVDHKGRAESRQADGDDHPAVIQRPAKRPHIAALHPAALLDGSMLVVAAPVFALEQPRAERGRQGEGHQHRDQNRDGHGPAELVEVALGVARHEGDGHEDNHQRERGRHHRQCDLLGRLHRRLLGGHVGVLLEEAVDVFEDNDGVVDDNAHGEGQPQQRHRVQREVHRPQQREGGHDRGRDGERGDQHRAPVADEQPHDDGGEQAAQHQVLFQRLDRVLDVGGLFFDDVDLDAGGQAGVQIGDPRENRVDNLDRVGAGLPPHLEDNGRLALIVSETAALGHAVLGMAHIPDPQRRAGDVLDDDVVEFADLSDSAQGAHADFGRPAHNAPAGGLDVLLLDGALHVLGRQPVTGQLVEVEQDVDLPLAPPTDAHAAHSVHRFQGAPDGLVADLGQLAGRPFAADARTMTGSCPGPPWPRSAAARWPASGASRR
jgi:hypothetical protein